MNFTKRWMLILACMVLCGVTQGLETTPCPLLKYGNAYEDKLTFSNFAMVDNLLVNNSNCSEVFSSFGHMYLIPTSYQILDFNQFNPDHFAQSINPSVRSFTAEIHNLNGFVLSDNYPKLITQMRFTQLDFNFFTQDNHLISLDCTGYNQLSLKQKKQIQLFWSTFAYIIFDQVGFKSQWCPMVFNNVTMNTLEIYTPKYGQRLVFEQYDQAEMSGQIMRFLLGFWHMIKLDKRLLHPQIFAKTYSLFIQQSSVKEIEFDVFKDLSSLTEIILIVYNLKSIYYTGNNKWMQYLNYKQKPFDFGNKTALSEAEVNTLRFNNFHLEIREIDFSNQSLLVIDSLIRYFYPDEDFCLFEKFPFEKLVIFQIDNVINVERHHCSCTMVWLFQYFFLYAQAGIYQITDTDCVKSQQDLDQFKAQCNFTQKRALCEKASEGKSYDDVYADGYYLGLTIKQVKLFVLGEMQSVVGFVGAFSNILVFFTIFYNWRRKAELMNKQKNKSEEIYLLKEPLYKQMFYSSIVNSLYCLMFFLNSVVPCDNMNSKQALTCFNKDLGISVVESFLKLVSNFCLLQMSVHRFLLIGKEHSKMLERIGNIKNRTFLIVVLVVSTGLSSITYVEQVNLAPLRKLNAKYSHQLGYDSITFFLYYNSYFDQNQEATKSYLKHFSNLSLVFSLVIIGDLFSYFLYCLLSLILDLATIKKLKETIKEKEKNAGANFDREKFTQMERKGLTMVVLSSLFNFIFRMPELISIIVLYYLITQGMLSSLYACAYQNDCLSLISIADVFYIISISANLVFYVKFNSNFNASFMKLVSRVKCCQEAAKKK